MARGHPLSVCLIPHAYPAVHAAGLPDVSHRHILLMYRTDTSNRDLRWATAWSSSGATRLAWPPEPVTRETEAVAANSRSGVLELAVLGLLHATPMHGYELRKRLNALLGMFRAFSYGSLYPCLKQLLAEGLIVEDDSDRPVDPGSGRPLSGRRSRIVYKLTAEGKERLQDLLAQAGPSAWEDEGFGVHFAFFGQTRADVRLRILEGRRSRLEERLESVRAAMARTRERLDGYTLELHQHGLESVEREVRWLNELIGRERELGERGEDGHGQVAGPGTPGPPVAGTQEHGRPDDGAHPR